MTRALLQIESRGGFMLLTEIRGTKPVLCCMCKTPLRGGEYAWRPRSGHPGFLLSARVCLRCLMVDSRRMVVKPDVWTGAFKNKPKLRSMDAKEIMSTHPCWSFRKVKRALRGRRVDLADVLSKNGLSVYDKLFLATSRVPWEHPGFVLRWLALDFCVMFSHMLDGRISSVNASMARSAVGGARRVLMDPSLAGSGAVKNRALDVSSVVLSECGAHDGAALVLRSIERAVSAAFMSESKLSVESIAETEICGVVELLLDASALRVNGGAKAMWEAAALMCDRVHFVVKGGAGNEG